MSDNITSAVLAKNFCDNDFQLCVVVKNNDDTTKFPIKNISTQEIDNGIRYNLSLTLGDNTYGVSVELVGLDMQDPPKAGMFLISELVDIGLMIDDKGNLIKL
jgi:hypothetical protein